MTTKAVSRLAAVVLASMAMAASAKAACTSFRSASTYDPLTGAYAYWHSPLGLFGDPVVGRSWQLGAGTSLWDSTGGVIPCDYFLYQGGHGIGMNLDLRSCGYGCPESGSTLAVLAQHYAFGAAAFLLATVTETRASPYVNFNFALQGDHDLIVLPKPRVVSSSRAPGQVTLSLNFLSVANGLFGPGSASSLWGYRVLSARTAVRPRSYAEYFPLVLGSFPASGGIATSGNVVLDCTDPTDQWIATQLAFEADGVIRSRIVSEPLLVHCNPALAEPKYKLVPKTSHPMPDPSDSP